MEMPIQIIITLFIAIAVGSMVLMFSGSLLDLSAEEFIPTPVDEDKKLIEVDSSSSAQLAILINNCYQKSFNEVFMNDTCYIVHSKEPFEINEANILGQSVLESIKDNIVVIDNGQTNSARIYWNFSIGKVEVGK